MKTMKLSIAALAVVALTQATGCIFVSDSGPSQGVFHGTWALTQGGSGTTCSAVAAASVDYLSTRASDNMGFDDIFTCSDLAGDTNPLTIDDYTIAVDILDASNASLATNGPAVLDASFANDPCTIDDGTTCTIDLPNVEFAF